jgi:putative flippase GtrA
MFSIRRSTMWVTVEGLLRSSVHTGWLIQALKFLTVGASNTLLDGGLYLLLTRWLGLAAVPTLAKGISFSAGILNSFHWNRSWTFRTRARATKTLLPFVLANLAALVLNTTVMNLCLYTLALPEAISFVLATGSAFVWSFAISKFVVFRKK